MGLFDDDVDMEYSISAAEHDDIILQCFNQKRPRICSDCPAHPDHGGQCCFGDPGKFQPHLRECRECSFNYECEQETIDTEAEYQYDHQPHEQVHSRFSKRGGVTTKSELIQLRRRRLDKENGRRPLLTDADEHVKKTPTVDTVEEREESEAETMFQRFVKDVVWGALQGAFEMALAFLRHHRLP